MTIGGTTPDGDAFWMRVVMATGIWPPSALRSSISVTSWAASASEYIAERTKRAAAAPPSMSDTPQSPRSSSESWDGFGERLGDWSPRESEAEEGEGDARRMARTLDCSR